MITVTYAGPEGDLPTIEEVKRHKCAFMERVRRRYPEATGVVKLEFDSGGEREYHPHWHVVLTNIGHVPKDAVNRWWCEIVGPAWGSKNATRVEALRSKRGAIHYVAKYVAKDSGGLVHRAYPHSDLPVSEGDQRVHTGRLWSIFNRDVFKSLFAVLVSVSLLAGAWFFDFKRAARHVWPGVNDHARAGFTLYTDNPHRWLELALFYASEVGV
jgi:hypothetical protein